MSGFLEFLLLLGLSELLFPASVAGIGIAVYAILTTRSISSRKRRVPDIEMLHYSNTKTDHNAANRFAIMGLLFGVFFPWIIGLAVKLYLDEIGEPTYSISSFLNPESIVILLAVTIFQWCWPFLLLSLWVRSRHFIRFAPSRSFKERLLLARMTYLGGLGAAFFVFYNVFRRWDIMYIFVPIGLFLLPPMFVGYGTGQLILKRLSRYNKLT